MKKIVTGILAHVDAGKTSLSEALLYTAGSIRSFGRVDNKDAFLDTQEIERARGITIFSKQAMLEYNGTNICLLDTPGHVDFSAEMERTLSVLDYAILVISGKDGVQGHSLTLWKLLEKYNLPVFIFVNKMDQSGVEKDKVIQDLHKRFSDGCIEIKDYENDDRIAESIALRDEELLEYFLENGNIDRDQVTELIRTRKLFPCYFGSALKLQGIEEFMDEFSTYTQNIKYDNEFKARVYKITTDAQGNRLTHLKVLGGSLKVKDNINGEKINQIRIYSGDKYNAVSDVNAGDVCAVTGISTLNAGDGIGEGVPDITFMLTPVLNYRMVLPAGVDARQIMPKLMQLKEEDPQLNIIWQEELNEIHLRIMGEVQLEILKSVIKDRFNVDVDFDEGNIIYRETISTIVEGVGHFEPLRHYAEVHLLIEPGGKGSGIITDTKCSEDILDKNWQRLILTHLKEKEHLGVLTGSPITDIKITVIAGRSHTKHTEGGDFRQATYRAVRQGLMEAESVLLEPFYDFELRIPSISIGRAMSDIDKMSGTCTTDYNDGENAVLTGFAPVSKMRNYSAAVMAYTKGMGQLFCTFRGYEPCHNADEVITAKRYNPLADMNNTPDSVFCQNGAGFIVPWNQVKSYMHVSGIEERNSMVSDKEEIAVRKVKEYTGSYAQDKELEEIFKRTFGEKKTDIFRKKEKPVPVSKPYKPMPKKDSYLLVDGYNIIFAWDELNEIAKENIDGARMKLLDIMCNYQGFTKINTIVVFDAYKVKGHVTEDVSYNNINVVYTAFAQTADSYIEKFAHEMGKKHNVTVATSDRLEQIIILGEGCIRMSARDLYEEVNRVNNEISNLIN